MPVFKNAMTEDGNSAVIAGNPVTRSVRIALVAALAAIVLVPGGSAQAAQKCFGKKVNRVVNGNGGKVRLKFKEVAWVSGRNVTVIGKPYSRICAGGGKQIIHPGKGRTLTDAGPGNDRIILHPKSNRNKAYGGLGNDFIRGARGHDFLYGSPKKIRGGAPDRDRILGLGGNDRIFDYSGNGNDLVGGNGSDRIYSRGNAVSDIYGGNGTDFLYGNGGRMPGGRLERLFGEKGNDRLRADQPNNNGPAYLDGGEGDDWAYGTPKDDVILTHSGIKKLRGNGGDDLFVTNSKGLAKVFGGPGRDTISYEAHVPAGNRGPNGASGVRVELNKGKSLGQTTYTLRGIEDVIGSAFDDEITGLPGQRNQIDGGLGDDILIGQGNDGDVADGGLGLNGCEGFADAANCNDQSPGDFGSSAPLVDINEGGILTILGGRGADDISVGYDNGHHRYSVTVKGGGVASGQCSGAAAQSTSIFCPADANSLNGMLIYGGGGGDKIKLRGTIPRNMTTTINGGNGKNRIIGGPSKDFISTSRNSAGSLIEGRGNLDVLYINDDVVAKGGAGPDGIHMSGPCVGGKAIGGGETDSTIFAGSDRGVKASLAGGFAEGMRGGCRKRLKISSSMEKLEGSQYNDHLIIGRRMKAQQGKSTLLGREGRNILDSKNGRKNTVTTGPAAHRNKVIRDRKDKVVWGWGLAAF